MFKKAPRILFFIDGDMPSKREYADAAKLGPNTSFRNARFITDEGALEACDGVAGKVPARYADKYPSAEDALRSYVKAIEDAAREAADEAEDDGPELDFAGTGDGTKPPVTPAPAKQPEAPAKPAKAPEWKPNAGTGDGK